MSKSLGNTIDPIVLFNKFSPDTVRWYMMYNSNPYDNLKFDEKGVEEINNKMFGTLINTYNFFSLYSNIDNFTPNEDYLTQVDNFLDRWILSRLNKLILHVDTNFNKFDITSSVRAIQSFVIDDLSNWYIRLNRKRFWNNSNIDDKNIIYQILYTILVDLSKLIAPISPFYSDKLYKDLTNDISVHLTSFPNVNYSYINDELERYITLTKKVCSIGHSLRKRGNMKTRQPLQTLYINSKEIYNFKDLILNELNIKDIIFIDNNSSLIKKKAKPDFKKLALKYSGYPLENIIHEIKSLSQEQILNLEKNSILYSSNIDEDIFLSDVILSIDDSDSILFESENSLLIGLETQLTEELINEGLARELVNKLQNLRKLSNLNVLDKIKIVFSLDNKSLLDTIFLHHKDYIFNEVQILDISYQETDSSFGELKVNEYNILLKIIN
jgi:isoleucyl-tRNA synthetase